MSRIPFCVQSLLMYFLKLNSNLTLVEYETTAIRVFAGKTGKNSIKSVTNRFSMPKFARPMLPDLSIMNTMSSLDGPMYEIT